MTVYLSIIQNGVSSNDVHVTLDGHPVFTTEFSVSNVRVSDAYATDESQARSAVTQAVRSFDFVTPLLKNELGAIIKQSVFGKESARAHALTVSDGEEIYCYIVQFGNEVATVKAPQNVGVNVSLIEAIPEIVTFGEGWIATEADGSTYTVTAPEVPSRMLIFWGDGESDVLDTIKDPSVVEVVHTFKKEDLYTVRIFTEQTVSRRSASVPCEILEVLAESDRTVIVLGQKDKDGFWRYDCVIEWGDGDATHFDTMTANAETACEGASHVYEREGRYTVRICYRDRLWIAKEVTDGE